MSYSYAWYYKLQDEMSEDGKDADVDLLNTVARLAFHGDFEGTVARLPEARAIATREGPWLEVMVNHFEMQLYLGEHTVGEAALAPAVAHFERAQREDVVDCPQSICATDHLVGVYGNIDGPGWSQVRIEACDEILPRVNPRSNCFLCLVADRANAQADAGHVAEAIAWIDAQEQHRLDAGEKRSPHLGRLQAELLLRLGRADEALDLLKKRGKYSRADDSEGRAQQLQTLLAHAYAIARRDDEALSALPPWKSLLPSKYDRWLRTMALLAARSHTLNNWTFGQDVKRTLDHFAKVGSHRHVVDLSVIAIDLALRRGALRSARRHLELARLHQRRLQADCGAAVQLEACEAALAAAQVPAAPAPAEGLLAWMDAASEPLDPELRLQWLLDAAALRPLDRALAEAVASARAASGDHD